MSAQSGGSARPRRAARASSAGHAVLAPVRAALRLARTRSTSRGTASAMLGIPRAPNSAASAGAIEGTLVAEAEEVALHAKLGSYVVRVRDEQGDLIATFQGMTYRKSNPLV